MKAAQVMFGYAAVLILGGFFAFMIAAVGGTLQYTALIFTLVPAALIIAFAVMAGMYNRNHRIGMIGIHVGLVLPLLLGAAYGFRAYSALTADRPMYLVGTLGVLAAASFVALVLLIAMRPKPEDRRPLP